jgi:diguanylate cyclase (GGDEF)-like protein/PAS domain S-box-containing protein
VSEDLLQLFQATSHSAATWEWDLTAGAARYSSEWAAILGFGPNEAGEGVDAWLDRIHPQDLVRVRKELAAHLDEHTSEFHSEHRLLTKSGRYRWVLCRGVAERSPQGFVTRLCGTMVDIDDRKGIDPLTGLGNRLQWLDRMAEALDERVHSSWFAALIDFDAFQELNEHAGNEIADDVLREAAGRLHAAAARLWGTEAVILARAGGDEFALAAPCAPDLSVISTAAETMLACFEAPFAGCDESLTVTASVGVTIAHPGDIPGQILRDAELALSAAQEYGPKQWRLFEPELRDRSQMRSTLIRELRYAVERGQLAAVYQPQMDLRTGEIAGFEALLRWRHPELGMIAPADFIPLAEETGLILQAGEWILRESCRQLKQWQTKYPAAPGAPLLTMSVNLSARQIADPNLVPLVTEVLEENGLVPDCLFLELTESSLIAEKEAARDVLERLQKLGVGMMLDDFGTGYAGLSYLNALRFDALKIDRSFVARVDADPGCRAIVRTVLGLAQELQMSVIAEGIETDKQLGALRQMDCALGQGFYFSRPRDAIRAEELLLHGISAPGEAETVSRVA